MVVGCSSPVLVNMLGPENISAAFSGILAFCGLSSLIGPPLAGMMVGITISVSVHDSRSMILVNYMNTHFDRWTLGATPSSP